MVMREFSWTLFERIPILGIIRGMQRDVYEQVLPLYVKAGLTNIEITMNTPDVRGLIKYTLEQYGSQLNVGAGTVCSLDDLKKALDAGAQFVVTPIVNEEVICECLKRGIPIFPGAMTPSEIHRASSLGIKVVKLFPAGNLGVTYLKDVRGPLSSVRFLPTGGISLENMASFLKAGVDGFGIGSPLFDKTMIDAQDWDGLYKHFRSYVTLMDTYKSNRR